jgi:hypothetical protein
MLTQDCCLFYDDLSVYGGFGGVVLASAEGKELAKALGEKNKNLICQNHGYVPASHLRPPIILICAKIRLG